MTALDDLTHNFINSPDLRTKWLKQYGQYFENGVRYTYG